MWKPKKKKKNIPKPEQTHQKKPKNRPTGARPTAQTQQTHSRWDPGRGSRWLARSRLAVGLMCLHYGSADPRLLPSLLSFLLAKLLLLLLSCLLVRRIFEGGRPKLKLLLMDWDSSRRMMSSRWWRGRRIFKILLSLDEN